MIFAEKHCFLTGAGCVFLGISAAIGLVPYLCMWNVMKLAMTDWPSRMDGSVLMYWEWMAVILSPTSILIYLGALMCTHLSVFHTVRNMKTVVPHHLTRFPVGCFRQRGNDKPRYIIDDGTKQTGAYPAHQLPDLAGALVILTTVLVLSLVSDWRFGLISLIPVVMGASFLSCMMRPGMTECMRQYQNTLEDMNNETTGYVGGIPVVKTFQRSISSSKSFYDSILRYQDWVVNYTVSLRVPTCAYTASINGTSALLIPAGTLFAGDISGGATYETIILGLLFHILFIPICVFMMGKIMWTSESMMTARDTMNRILDIIKEKPLSEPTVATTPSGYIVKFRDAPFSYDNTKTDALSRVSLTVPQGATAAVVGVSGNGKITLVNLVPRFFDADRGGTYIGDVGVKEIGSEELMKLVSFVPQDYCLFRDSLLNNIRAVRPQVTKEEVIRTVAAAWCRDTIEKMPQGPDTVVGTEGAHLPGGEAQRIALARVTLKNAPVVPLDETTTFADSDNEYLIQQTFKTPVKRETVVMITHRLSIACHSDRIFVLERGWIAEQGHHEEFLRSEGLYTKMWKDYQTLMEWKVGGEV